MVSADMKNVLSVYYRYQQIWKLDLSVNIGIGRYGKIHIVCTLLKLFSNLLQIIFNKVFIQPISIFLNTYQHFKLNEYLFLKVSAIISNKVLVVTQTQTTRFQPKVCSFANRHLLRKVRRSVSLKNIPRQINQQFRCNSMGRCPTHNLT